MILKYGKKSVSLNIDKKGCLRVISPNIPSKKNNEVKIVEYAIENPINSLPLSDFINEKDRILIVIPDKTRICKINLILPVLLNRLKSLMISDKKITIIFANGSHSKQSKEEKIKIVGKHIYKKYKIIEHDAFDDSQNVFFGKTKYGTKIYLNKILQETDKIITIGTVVHHYFAGFGGGAKLLVPGLAHYSTIQANHKRTIKRNGTLDKFCKSANIINNPVYNDIIDSLKFCPKTFAISTVLDQHAQIRHCLSGNLLEIHNELMKFVDKYYQIQIKEKSDLTIVSAGGYPKDINFIQSHKSIQNAYQSTRKNGVVICLAECSDGIGSKTFLDWFQFSNESEFKTQLINNYSLNAQTALSLKEKTKNCTVILVSELSQRIVQKMGMVPAKNIKDALLIAKKYLSDNFKFYVIQNGSLVVPKYIDE